VEPNIFLVLNTYLLMWKLCHRCWSSFLLRFPCAIITCQLVIVASFCHCLCLVISYRYLPIFLVLTFVFLKSSLFSLLLSGDFSVCPPVLLPLYLSPTWWKKWPRQRLLPSFPPMQSADWVPFSPSIGRPRVTSRLIGWSWFSSTAIGP